MSKFHIEHHKVDAISWLRAAVLGANDGIVSTASLLVGVVAAHASHDNILLTGIAGLVAGAMSMATGEYVSVHSQADSEHAALSQEKYELANDPVGEHRELMGIYMRRGLNQETAHLVATQLMAHDALDAHARDELGISETTAARPVQAALVSALSFAIGAALPLAVVLLAPAGVLLEAIVMVALASLAVLGAVAARTGGANVWKGAMRVSLWSSIAMASTAAIGSIFGAVV
ncbi:MAG: VIT family protein [Herbaspirillum sp.]|nr:VIT family protein [Herbaspirillum sp.]